MWRWAGPRLRTVLEELPSSTDRAGDWFTALALSTDLMEGADARGQQEAVTGLRRVDPYLDPSFAGLLASIPPAKLFHEDRYRGLYSHAMKGILPDTVRLRSDKASFEPVPFEILESGGRARVEELLEMEALGDLGLVDPPAFRAAFARAGLAGSPVGWLGVWPALSVEAFVRGRGRKSPGPRDLVPAPRGQRP